MHRIKKLTAVTLSVLTVSGVCVAGSSLSASASGTGAGLAEYALNAYYSGWSYVWGGAEPGAVDCSGLIWSYCGGNRISMLSDAIENGCDYGSVDSGIPRVHGLGLSRPGHVGVYIADNMEVDARGSDYGVCYDEIGGWNSWDYWFKLAAVSYPENGWENFNGDYYYYEGGEYIVNTSRTIDGTTYYFDGSGRSSTSPSNAGASYSNSTGNSGSSSSSSSQSSTPSVWKNGSSGDEVVKIQKRLAELGFYDGAIDGDFGNQTEKAYIAFQQAAGVLVDGIAGSDRDVLYSDDAPYANAKAEVKEEVKSDNEEKAPAEEAKTDEEPKTEAATEASAPAYAQNGDFTEDVLDIQQRLYELGYFDIEPTGFFGDYTTEALMSFQLCNDLEITGEINEATLNALHSEEAVMNPTAMATFATTNEDDVVAGPSPIDESPLTVNTYAATSDEPLAVFGSTSGNSGSSNGSSTENTTVVDKTNSATEKALKDSASIIPDARTAQVKRSANVWIWLVLTAVIIGAVSFILLFRDRKKTRTAKKKPSTKAQLNTRW